MPRHKIFVSYSKKDHEIREALTVHLSTFDAELSIWSDQDIKAGSSWDRDIHDAMKTADAAVLLVSPDFLATKYVKNVEIPFLLEAVEGRGLLFMPLFIRASNADAIVFDQALHPKTGELGARITDFQGLNRPDQPLAALSAADRDDVLAKASRQIWDSLQKRPSPREKRRTTTAQTLTVELRLSGRHVDRSYSRPAEGTFRQNTTGVDFDLLQNLRDRGEFVALGEKLFEMLYGNEKQWSEVLPLSGRRATPAAVSGLRTRILTDDSTLLDLPWPTCHWRRHDLTEQGWTFELVSRAGRPTPVWLEAPCPALMIGGAEVVVPLKADAHSSSFQGALDRAWDHPPSLNFKCVKNVDEALEALENGPKLVYIYAQVEMDQESFSLVLCDAAGQPQKLPFERLAKAMADRQPAMVVLNTFGVCPAAPPLKGVRILLHLRHELFTSVTSRKGFEARSQAMAFWSDVLEGRWDPVKAFHELGEGTRQSSLIRTDYDVFETRVADHTPKVDRARSRLDRKVQREAVMTMVRELVKSRHRRLTCVVAYGSEGNLVEHFAVQVVDTLKDWARELTRIRRYSLELPNNGKGGHHDDFEDLLRDYFHLQPHQELSAAFSKGQRRGGATPPLHFVDWGCYGVDGRDVPSGATLESWLTYCCDHLAVAVQGRGRILSYIALVLPQERHEGLRQFLDAQSHQPQLKGKTHFHVQHLQPLKKIKPQDLRDFLADDENTSCEPAHRSEIAERICQWTDGEFEATVEQLEKAEHGNLWPELIRTLPKAEPVPTVTDF